MGLGDDLVELLLLGVLGIGASSEAMWCRTASFLGSFTGMLMRVPSDDLLLGNSC